MMRKLLILSGATLLSLLACAEKTPRDAGEVVFSQDFESSLCGTMPRGLNDQWRSRNPTNELCRYVTNVDAATGKKSLMYDFSQLKPGSRTQRGVEHCWLAWRCDPKLTNGWIHWSVSVKRLSCEMSGEIRADLGSRTDPKERRDFWIAYWLRFGEEFTVRNEARDAKTISIGALPKGRWCKIDLMLPLPCNAATNAWGQISVKGHNGKFKPGPRVAIPLGDMRLLSGHSLMQIGGGGTSKWLIDDISVTHIEK